jgi:serine/threonine-protein kinase
MGVVYQAWDQLLGRLVALKLLPAGLWWDSRAREHFLDEAVAIGRVQHPNVLTAFDFAASDEEPPYLVMEWIDGGSVAELLRDQGVLSPRRATQITAAVCRALGAVHGAGLIHRDVKPANLLLPTRGGVKLADFGLAKSVDGSGVAIPADVTGTPAYFSPEQAWCQPLDRRTDLYSLGATYYEMLTGQKPFQADGLWDYLWLHREAPVPDPRDENPAVPAVCAEVVRRGMAKEPSQRYPNAGAMLATLEKALAHPEVRT